MLGRVAVRPPVEPSLLSVIRDEDVIVVAREEATRLLAVDPHLFANAELRRAVEALVDDERADYLEKA